MKSQKYNHFMKELKHWIKNLEQNEKYFVINDSDDTLEKK